MVLSFLQRFHLFFSSEITNKNEERKAVTEGWWHILRCLLAFHWYLGDMFTQPIRIILSNAVIHSTLIFPRKRIIKDFFKYLSQIQIMSVRVLPYPGAKEFKDVIKVSKKCWNSFYRICIKWSYLGAQSLPIYFLNAHYPFLLLIVSFFK